MNLVFGLIQGRSHGGIFISAAGFDVSSCMSVSAMTLGSGCGHGIGKGLGQGWGRGIGKGLGQGRGHGIGKGQGSGHGRGGQGLGNLTGGNALPPGNDESGSWPS